MSPRAALPLEAIVEAAWNLVRELGGAKLNARNLASRLGSSTMPIYSSVGSMIHLDGLLRQRVAEELQIWQQRSWGPNPMLDMAMGYVMFAREEPRLFQYLFSKSLSGEVIDMGKALKAPEATQLLISSPSYPEFIANMARDRQNAFVFQTWIFVHGLANLIAEGLLTMEPAELSAQLEAAGAAFYFFHQQKGDTQ